MKGKSSARNPTQTWKPPQPQSRPAKIEIVDIFRRPENIPPVVDSAIAIGAKVIWMQLGIEHAQAAAKAVAAGLIVVMDACFFVEHKRRRGSLTRLR